MLHLTISASEEMLIGIEPARHALVDSFPLTRQFIASPEIQVHDCHAGDADDAQGQRKEDTSL